MNSRKAQLIDAVLTAAPTCVFVVLSGTSTVGTALIWTLLLSVLIVLFQMVRREPVLHALIGCLVAVLGGIVAAMTGEARGYFLLSAILPVVITLVCLITVMVRRPLAGLLLNKLAGGPAHWYRVSRLRSIYFYATLVCAGVNVATAALQKIFYANRQTALLAVVHVATGPIFAVIMGITIAAARRQVET